MAKLLVRRFPDWTPPRDPAKGFKGSRDRGVEVAKKQSGYVDRKPKAALDYSKWLGA